MTSLGFTMKFLKVCAQAIAPSNGAGGHTKELDFTLAAKGGGGGEAGGRVGFAGGLRTEMRSRCPYGKIQ
jgi:hypothetical protein